MKKNIIIILSLVLLLSGCSVGIYNKAKKEPTVYHENKGIETSLTLVDNLAASEDNIWCGTFQLLWNDLKKERGGDIIPLEKNEDFTNLNKSTFQEKDLSSSSYYKTYGKATYTLKKTIEDAILEKFNETSNVLNDVTWSDDSEDYVFYAMLKKEFKFTYKFSKLATGKFNSTDNVRFFGANANDDDLIKNQINILYYEDDNDFAIVLHSDTDDIIFVKNPRENNFLDIYNAIYEKENNYEGSTFLSANESFKVPYISIKEKKEFSSLYNTPYKGDDNKTYEITKAIQTIDFELKETGGSIKSEAIMQEKETSSLPSDKIRHFNVDSSFAMFLVEKGKHIPYYAALVNDITKFQ